MRMLVVEETRMLAGAMASALARADLTPESARTVAEAEELLSSYAFDAVVLDLDEPREEDGIALLRKLRKAGNKTPMVVLSDRVDPYARVEGLKAGADDYLSKPFLFDELVARIEAVMRRVDDRLGPCISAGNVSYDLDSGIATVDGGVLALSPRERKLLELLLRRKERVVPIGTIQDHLCGLNDLISTNALEVCVHRLRKKLANKGCGLTIENVRGLGYKIASAASVLA